MKTAAILVCASGILLAQQQAQAYTFPLQPLLSRAPGAGFGRNAVKAAGGKIGDALLKKRSLAAAPLEVATAQQAAAVAAEPMSPGAMSKLSAVANMPRGGGMPSVDIPLLSYFFFWYLGNYYYNITNKLALKAAGGSTGFPMAIATLQLAVGCMYALFLWVAPDARKRPKITLSDVKAMIPVGICAAGAHSASVFALSAGAVSFGQIVKSAEPAFAAVLATTVYRKKISKAKWLCLIPVIGGVILASVKELDFAWSALIAACVANLFAAFKGNENKKLMETEGIKDRIGNVGNQFAITNLLATLFSIPLIFLRGESLKDFAVVLKDTPVVMGNLIASGLFFYGYNELATMTIKKTSAVTQSVANTAKRVIVIVGVALVLGESLDPIKLLGCAIGIGGVLLYSMIDSLVQPKGTMAKA